jgi:nicotinate dehydrogenase subunit A
MVISAAALLGRDPHPDEISIRDAFAGNLCRCGVYGRAIRAVLKAASPS